MSDVKKTVIVLGLACSGTSVIAGMLHHMGVNMNPSNNIKPGYPYGSFEDVDLQHLTRILTLKKPKPEERLTKREIKSKIKALIEKRTEDNDIWGFKNALTYQCLEWFLPYIKNPYFVVIFRNIVDNARSLQRLFADNYGENLTFFATIEMVIKEQKILLTALKNNLKDQAFFVTSFEGIEKDYFSTCIDLANFLNIEPKYMAFEKLSRLYIDEKTRHGKDMQQLFT